MLAGAPVSIRSPLIKSAFFFYVDSIIKKKAVRYKCSVPTQGTAKTQLELLKAEDEVKKISLYLWMAYKFPELFPDSSVAEVFRIKVNQYCEASLKSNKQLKAPERRRRRTNSKHHDTYKKRSNGRNSGGSRKEDEKKERPRKRRRRR